MCPIFIKFATFDNISTWLVSKRLLKTMNYLNTLTKATYGQLSSFYRGQSIWYDRQRLKSQLEKKSKSQMATTNLAFYLFGVVIGHTVRIIKCDHNLVISFIGISSSQPDLIFSESTSDIWDHLSHIQPLSCSIITAKFWYLSWFQNQTQLFTQALRRIAS